MKKTVKTMFPLASPEDVGAAFHSRHSVHVPGIDNAPECHVSCDLWYNMSFVMFYVISFHEISYHVVT